MNKKIEEFFAARDNATQSAERKVIHDEVDAFLKKNDLYYMDEKGAPTREYAREYAPEYDPEDVRLKLTVGVDVYKRDGYTETEVVDGKTVHFKTVTKGTPVKLSEEDYDVLYQRIHVEKEAASAETYAKRKSKSGSILYFCAIAIWIVGIIGAIILGSSAGGVVGFSIFFSAAVAGFVPFAYSEVLTSLAEIAGSVDEIRKKVK